MRFAGAALATALLIVALAPGTGWAHVRSTEGYSEITQEGSTVRYELSLERDVLAAAAGDAERRSALESYLLPRVQLLVDRVECEGAVRGTSPERRRGRAYVRVALAYECAGSPSGAYKLRYGVFAGDAVVDDHTNVAHYTLGGERGSFVFDAGHRQLDVGSGGALSSVPRFVELGFHHILGGLDHVLFLVVLLLGASGFGSVLKLATAFTVAHSVTLALAALGWVEVPAAIIEPLIALSIAYVAAENVLGGESPHRLGVVFGFGLLHGLGFAGSLGFSDEVDRQLLGALVSFNVGIELGQALIIAALFPLLLLARRRLHWSALAHSTAAIAAGTVGLAWYCDRLLA